MTGIGAMRMGRNRVLAAALVVAAALVAVAPVAPARAQTPPIPVPDLFPLIQGVQALAGQVLGVAIGPNADLAFSSDAAVDPDGQRMLIHASYTCSGLFLPLAPFDGPRTLDVIVTQGFPDDNEIVSGHRTITTPFCDGIQHSSDIGVAADPKGGVFSSGSAYVEMAFAACDITGCFRRSIANFVNAVEG
jgi:hypothetical protein